MQYIDQKLLGITRRPTYMYVWGDNSNGLVTTGVTQQYSWSQLSAGGKHTLGIRNDGLLFAWGYNGFGQLGDGTSSDKLSPVQIGTNSWSQISAGDNHSLGITATGALYTWGDNRAGQLGDGTAVSKSEPILIDSNSWTSISAGASHSTGIRSTGGLFAWGDNRNIQLGDGSTISKSSPVQIGTTTQTSVYRSVYSDRNSSLPYTALVTNGGSALSLSGDFTLEWWFYVTPEQLNNNNVHFISTGKFTNSLSMWWWSGTQGNFILIGWGGLFATNAGTTPYYPSGGQGWATAVDISATGWYHMAFVRIGTNFVFYLNGVSRGTQTLTGTLDYSSQCYLGGAPGGKNDPEMMLGYMSNLRIVKGVGVYTGNFIVPKSPLTATQSAGANISAITGSQTSLLLFQNTTPFVDGSVSPITVTVGNGVQSDFSPFSNPTMVYSSFSQVAAGKYFNLAVDSNGALYTWGDNTNGQLGVNSGFPQNTLLQLGSSSWTQIASGESHAAAITTTGKLYTWGSNVQGQLGTNSAPSAYWTTLSYGGNHVLGLKSDGSLWSWGDNTKGQVGDTTYVHRSSPVQIGNSSWTSISAGSNHSLAIRSDGGLFGWGENNTGQAGNTATSAHSWTQIAGGPNHFAGIKKDGSLWTAGYNADGRLGVGDYISRSSPVQVGSDSWISIASGDTFNYGIKNDGTLWYWGDPNTGSTIPNFVLGIINPTSSVVATASPVQVNTLGPWLSVRVGYDSGALGYYYTHAIKSDGTLWAWGGNNLGQLGTGDTLNRSSPVQIAAGSSFKAVYPCNESSSGGAYTMFIRTDGTLYGTGKNNLGQIGDGTTVNRSGLTLTQGSMSWTQLHSTGYATYGIRTDSTLWAWGATYYDAGGSYVYRSSPTQIGTSSWTSIGGWSGSSQTYPYQFGTTIDNRLLFWQVQVFAGNFPAVDWVDIVNSPNSIPSVGTSNSWSQVISQYVNGPIASGNAFFTATNGDLYVWGNNNYGLLGVGTTTSSLTAASSSSVVFPCLVPVPFVATVPSPVQIGTSSWSQISAGYKHSLALDVNNKLYGWGSGSLGQLNLYPKWTSIAAGTSHTIAIRGDGTLWAWGDNTYGQLGDSTVASRSTPVQISTRTNAPGNTTIPNSRVSFTRVAAGDSFSLALASDGTLWGVGDNRYGQMPSFSVWTKIALGGTHGLGIRSDGTLWGWGDNSWGQLGLNNTSNQSIPQLIGRTTDTWLQIAAGERSSAAIKSDGTLWTWGLNLYGALGQNTGIWGKSSPVQVGTSSWSFVTAGRNGFEYREDGQQHWQTASMYAAITTDKVLHTWGIGNYGQLGHGDVAARHQIVPVGTTVTANTYSICLPMTSGYGRINSLTVPFHSSHVMGANNWTIEFWYYLNTAVIGTGNVSYYVARSVWLQGTAIAVGIPWNTDGKIHLYVGSSTLGTTTDVAATIAPIYNQWGHYAVVRNGGTVSLYVNGSSVASVGTLGTGIIAEPTSCATTLATGGQGGFISNFRYVNGTALYTGNFTPPTTPLTAIANTVILAAQNDTISKDNSVNNLTLTWADSAIDYYYNYGDSIMYTTAFSPFSNNLIAPATNTSWVTVAAGGMHTLAINNANKLYAFGLNNYGQLGDNTTSSKSSPIQIGTSSWTSVAAGTFGHSLAVTSTGLLFSWGRNNAGQLGQGDNLLRSVSSPVQIGTNSNWSQVDSGKYHSIAKTTDNYVYGWGDAKFFQIPSASLATMPISWVPTTSTSSNGRTMHFKQSDGTMWIWGLNDNGQLGFGTVVARSSPIQIGSLSGTILSPGQSWLQAATGYSHSMAIRSDNTLWAIGGWNDWGQLGVSDTANRSSPVQIPGSWSLVATGLQHTVALKTDGTLWAWGYNGFGQLGNLSTVSASSPVQVSNSVSLSFTQITAGDQSTYGITSNGRLFAWGANSNGQLGDTSTVVKSSPVQVASTGSWTQVSAGASHVLAIRTDGALGVWGQNNYGQLGDGGISSKTSPIIIAAGSSFSQVSAGREFSTAIATNGTLYAWGLNSSGQLGDLTTINRSSIVQVSGSVASWAFVRTMASSVAAIPYGTTTLYVWGTDTNAELGRNQIGVHASSPVQLGYNFKTLVSVPLALGAYGTPNYSYMAAGGEDTALIDINSKYLYLWGKNDVYQLGDGTSVNKSAPVILGGSESARSSLVQLGTFTSWSQIAAGSNHIVLRDINGLVYTAGMNTYGQLGDNTNIHRSGLVQVNNSWSQITAGLSHTAAIRTDGTLYTWGINTRGQLGDATTITRSSPVQVSGSTSWSLVSAGASHTLGIDTSSKLYGWGDTTYGQYFIADGADNFLTYYSWSQVTTGTGQMALAIRSDGTLWSWGNNNNGQLGDGTTINKSSPVQIGTSTWLQVRAGNDSVVAIKADSTMWAWGNNANLQVGDLTNISRSSPVQVAGGGSWLQIAAHNISCAAIKLDGSLWTWGNATQGNLGDNTVVAKSSPVKIGSSSWSSISAGGNHMIGILKDNTIYGWGYNLYGQLGDNTIVNRSSPVQVNGGLAASATVPGSWTFISTATHSSAGIRSDGTLYTWGLNTNGVLGDLSTTHRSSPVQVAGGGSWSTVSIKYLIAFGIKSDNTLWGWGTGNFLPSRSDFISQSSPIPIGTTVIAGGVWQSLPQGGGETSNVFAIRTDGTMYAWGDNNSGILGVGDLSGRNNYTPVLFGQIPNYYFNTPKLSDSYNSWTAINASTSYSAGIRSNNAAYGWGNNSFNQINAGTSANIVGSAFLIRSSASQIGTGAYHMGIVADNMLYMTGYNTNGQLGQGDTVARSSPVQVSLSTYLTGVTMTTASPVLVAPGKWNSVAAGYSHSLAVRSDSTLWAWGYNDQGQLGDKTVVFRSSPVQVTSYGLTNFASNSTVTFVMSASPVQVTSWASVKTGPSHSLALTTDGRLYGWGANWINSTAYAGSQLGQFAYPSVAPQYQFKGSSTAVQIGSVDTHCLRFNAGNIEHMTIDSTGLLNSVTSMLIEAWVHPVRANGVIATERIYVGDPGNTVNFALYFTNGSVPDSPVGLTPTFGTNMITGQWTSAYASTPLELNKWYHLAGIMENLTNGGTMIRIYVDGVLAGSTASNSTWTGTNSTGVRFGGGWYDSDGTNDTGGANHFSGYMADVRMIQGANALTTYNLGGFTPNKNTRIPTGASVAGTTFLIGQNAYPTIVDYGPSGYTVTLVNMTAATAIVPVPGAGQPGNKFLEDVVVSWSDAYAGFTNTVALTPDNKLYTWGDITKGQAGDGIITPSISSTVAPTLQNSSRGVSVNTIKKYIAVAAGENTIIAVDSNRNIYGWGANPYGQLPNKPSHQYLSWSMIAHKDLHTLALREDGMLFAWGWNAQGQLGTGDTIQRSSPTQIGTSSWVAIAAGQSYSAAIDIYGNLFTWGAGANGLLADGTSANRSSPVAVTLNGTGSPNMAAAWSTLFVSNTNMFGIRVDGTLWGWGLNTQYQLGTGESSTFVGRTFSSPIQIGTASNWTQVSSGNSHTLALNSLGQLYAWGNNSFNQIGTWNNNSFLVSWIQVTDGAAIRSDNRLFIWGDNSAGFLGNNTVVSQSSPVQVPGSWASVSARASAPNMVAAIKTDGTLWTWGNNSSGMIGDGTIIHRSSPVQVPSSYTKPAISASAYSLCFNGSSDAYIIYGNSNFDQTVDFTVETWIYLHNDVPNSETGIFGQEISGFFKIILGNPTGTANQNVLVITQAIVNQWITGTTYLLKGVWYHIALQRKGTDIIAYINGTVEGFVSNPGNFVAASTSATTPIYVARRTDSTTPYFPGLLSNLRYIKNQALFTGSTVGVNYFTPSASPLTTTTVGHTGAGAASSITGTVVLLTAQGSIPGKDLANTTTLVPMGIPVASNFSSQFSSYNASLSWLQASVSISNVVALRSDYAVFSWGAGAVGQLGLLNFPTPWKKFTTGAYRQMLAIGTDGSLWTWGNNAFGALGTGTTVARSNPVQVGLSSWTMVTTNPQTHATGAPWVAAIRTDGGLFTWGIGTNGVLGSGATAHRSSPVQVGAGSWISVAAGASATVGISSTGAIYSWGINTGGWLGDGTLAGTVTRSSPVLVPTAQSWLSVAAGHYQFAAIRLDGTLWVWGTNSGTWYGGDGGTIGRSSPVQVAGGGSWSQVFGGPVGMYAIKTDGTLWGWGQNNWGQLGDGTTTDRFSPVPIGTGSWTYISSQAGSSGNLAYFSTWGIKTDGSLWAWGKLLGINALGLDIVTTPVQISTSSWSMIGVNGPDASQSVAGATIDGQLWAWGINTNGQLGDGTTITRVPTTAIPYVASLVPSAALAINKSSPVQIGTQKGAGVGPAANSWIAMTTGLAGAMTIKSDGTLWGWGANSNGQLGDGTTLNRSSPVQIGTSSWALMTTNAGSTIAIRTDGTLFTWGANASGQLGQNNLTAISSPVTVGTSPVVSDANSYSLWFRKLQTIVGPTNNTAVNLSSGAWTVEFYVYLSDNYGKQGLIQNAVFGATALTYNGWVIDVNNRNIEFIAYNSADYNALVTSTVKIPALEWTHVAVQSTGTTVTMYINGLVAGSGSQGTIAQTSNVALYLGAFNSSLTPYFFNGFLSNIRITKGQALFSGKFTPSTSSLTTSAVGHTGTGAPGSITGTVTLLTAQSATIIDNSSSALTFTNIRATGVSVNTPFYTTVLTNIPYVNAVMGDTYSLFQTAIGGKLYGAGLNSSGQLGDTTSATKSSPVLIGSQGLPFISIAAGMGSFGIRKDNATLYAWGVGGGTGNLGIGVAGVSQSSPTQIGGRYELLAYSPIQIAAGTSFTQVSAGWSHSTAIDTLGKLYVWGDNGVSTAQPGGLGIGVGSWTQLQAGITVFGTNYYLRSDGSLWAVGYNTGGRGQLGDGTTLQRSSPTQIGSSFIQFSSGAEFAIGIKYDGTLWAWGYNNGNFGDGYSFPTPVASTLLSRSSPVQVNSGSWNMIAASQYSVGAIKYDGTLWAWGAANTYGEQGLGDTVVRLSPVQIGTDSNWTAVVSAGRHYGRFAIKSDKTLYAWGQNTSGELGDGTVIHRSSPVQIPGSWTHISAGANGTNTSVAGIQTDGSLWTWGFNSSGQLGQGDTVARSSPTKVGSSTWKTVHMGQTGMNMYALDTSNKLWYCGNPTGGAAAGYAYGFGETVARSTLVQLAGTTTWYDYGSNNIIQRLGGLWPYSNGDLYEWGSNLYGMLGDGTTQSRSSPVQVATTRYVNTMASPVQVSTSISWTQVAAAASYTLAITSNGALTGWGYNAYGMFGTADTVSTYSAPSSLSTSYFTYTIGAGGVANATNGGSPVDGGATIVNFNGVTLTANGGKGGTGPQYDSGFGGAGGTATGGTTNVTGGAGGTPDKSQSYYDQGGGGGGVAAADLPVKFLDVFNDGQGQTGQAGADISPSYFTALAALGISTGHPGQGGTRAGNNWGSNATGFGSGGGGGGYIGGGGNGYYGGGGGGVSSQTSNYLLTPGVGGQGCIILKLTNSLGVVSYQLLTSGYIYYPPANISTIEMWVVGAGGAGGTNAFGALTSSGGGGAGGIAYRSFSLAGVSTSKSYNMITAGQYSAFGTVVTNNNYAQLYAWGYNNVGQLGTNTITNASSPVQITSLNILNPVPYYYRSNTLLLSYTGAVSTSSPVQVGTSSWNQVEAGSNHTIAKDTNGLLYAWGTNTNGQLGDGTTINKSSPVQISSSSFASVSAGSNHNVIKKSDGSIYSFGSNSNGQLGDGT